MEGSRNPPYLRQSLLPPQAFLKTQGIYQCQIRENNLASEPPCMNIDKHNYGHHIDHLSHLDSIPCESNLRWQLFFQSHHVARISKAYLDRNQQTLEI
jgi:hypothetical protein